MEHSRQSSNQSVQSCSVARREPSDAETEKTTRECDRSGIADGDKPKRSEMRGETRRQEHPVEAWKSTS